MSTTKRVTLWAMTKTAFVFSMIGGVFDGAAIWILKRADEYSARADAPCKQEGTTMRLRFLDRPGDPFVIPVLLVAVFLALAFLI